MRCRQLLLLVLAFLLAFPQIAASAEPLDIGSRRELFVDKQVVGQLEGEATLQLHQPEPHEVVLVTDKPWEGNTCAYYTVFQDGDRYRMYYRGSHYDEEADKAAHREVTCYAESEDGIHWEKPELGVVEFNGSKQNNIVWDGIGTHCFTVFKDGNPECKPEARYKAISRGRPRGKKGLYVFKSPDAIHWSLMHPEPVITEGAFDSQNLAFWDSHRGLYVDYHRTFHQGLRDIMTATSEDYIHWTEPVRLKYSGAPREHLYTNAILRYERAPHLLLGFPTRYLPKQGSRVEPTLMASRDGRTFHRWSKPLIPEDAPENRSGNRSNYMAWGLVQLPDNDREYSVYASEAYYTGPDSRLRRFTFRVDGFVSAHADGAGQLITKPLVFSGKQLEVNFETREGGSLRVELQDASGEPIDGFAADDCQPLKGDEISGHVQWNGRRLGQLAGKPVRVCFHLEDADLYSFRFHEDE